MHAFNSLDLRIQSFDLAWYFVGIPQYLTLLLRRWLNEAGFAIGAKVRVQVKPGRLVLTVEKG